MNGYVSSTKCFDDKIRLQSSEQCCEMSLPVSRLLEDLAVTPWTCIHSTRGAEQEGLPELQAVMWRISFAQSCR